MFRTFLAAGLVAGVAVGFRPQECFHQDTVLFVAHAFDVSRSHGHDMASLVPELPALEAKFEEFYFKRVSAVASFSDKPQRPFGDPRGDYCYREDRVFGEASVVETANGLKIRSGIDWKESQLEAARNLLMSESIGWVDVYEGKSVQRVVIVNTDALPHVAGDFSVCVAGPNTICANEEDPCLASDYPSIVDIDNVAAAGNVIFVVTSDVYRPWSRLVKDYDNLHVVERSEMNDEVVNRILEILCGFVPILTPAPTADPPATVCSVGTAVLTCNEFCGIESCNEDRTALMNSSSEECGKAIDEAFGLTSTPNDIQSEFMAVGCNYGLATRSFIESRYKPVPAGAEGGCNADAAASSTPNITRMCCCDPLR